MSFWPEIKNNKQGISSMNDLIQIVSIVNQLYSSLSQLAIVLSTENTVKGTPVLYIEGYKHGTVPLNKEPWNLILSQNYTN